MRPFARLITPLLLTLSFHALAAPGAHGPNGEHLDGPASSAMASDGRPRMEAFTEVFELVARLEADALTVMINDYATNAPVDAAEVELQSGELTAAAEFDPASGEYRFTDAALLEALNRQGKHSMAFTVTAGDEFDIVAGALDVEAHRGSVADGHSVWPWVAVALLALLSIVFVLRRRSARIAGARA